MIHCFKCLLSKMKLRRYNEACFVTRAPLHASFVGATAACRAAVHRIPTPAPADLASAASAARPGQGLTLVHFSARPEPVSDTKYTLDTPWYPVNTPSTTH